MNYQKQVKQLKLDFVREQEEKHVPAKRVDIVSVRMVKECSLMYKDRVVGSPQDGANLMRQFLGDVDTNNQPTVIKVCHIGSLNSSIVHPREVMKPAILSNAAGVIVDHNHPSGNPEPSQEDIQVTRKLVEAGEIVGIEVLDHIILGDGHFDPEKPHLDTLRRTVS